MCYGDSGLKNLLRDTEARMAPLAQAMNEDRQALDAAKGWAARLRKALARWTQKEARA